PLVVRLYARIQPFGVLAEDDQIDVAERRLDAGQRAARADVGVQVELLAELDVDALETLPDRSRDGPLERDVVPADRVHHGIRQRRSVRLDRRGPYLVDPFPLDLDAGRLQH